MTFGTHERKSATSAGTGLRSFALATKTAHVAVSIFFTFLGLTAVTFVIGRVIPIDPVLAIVGDRAPQDVYERVRLELGLDRSLWVQYWAYLGQVLQGNFGTSVLTSRDVLEDIARGAEARTLHHHVPAGQCDRPARQRGGLRLRSVVRSDLLPQRDEKIGREAGS